MIVGTERAHLESLPDEDLQAARPNLDRCQDRIHEEAITTHADDGDEQ